MRATEGLKVGCGGMGGFAKVDNEKWLQGGSMAFFSSLTIHRFFSFFHDII
jgi:hypothetical protein